MLGYRYTTGLTVRTIIISLIVLILCATLLHVVTWANESQDESASSQPKEENSPVLENQEVQRNIATNVEVDLTFVDGDLRPELASDLKNAILEVARMALIDQLDGDLEYITENLTEITETLSRVIDLTLSKRGFKIDKLEIIPGETTIFSIDISISGGEIIDIEVDLLPPNLGSLSNELLLGLKSDLTSALRRRFQGLPTSDINWLYKLFDEALRDEQNKIDDFKWFDFQFEISPGAITRLILHLNPKASTVVIGKHYLRTRSSTLLNISLEDLREVILKEISCLDGMPVDFIRTHRDSIEMYLTERVEGLKTIQFYDADADVTISFKGNELQISAIVESQRFRTSVSGQVDFNKDEGNPLIEGRIGVMGGEYAELYTHVKFYPDNVDFEPELGFGLNPTPGIFLGGGWDFDRETTKLRGDVWFGTNVLVSVEQYTDPEFNDDSRYTLAYFLTRDIKVSATMDGAGTGFFSLGVVL